MKSFLKLASVVVFACGIAVSAEGMNNQQNSTDVVGTTNQIHLVIIKQDFFNRNVCPNRSMNFTFTLNLADPEPCLQQMLVLIYQTLVAANPQRTAAVGGPLTEEQMRSTAVNMTNQQAERLGLNYRVQLQQANAIAEAVNDMIEGSDPRNNNSSH